MSGVAELEGRHVYLDANAIIASVEGGAAEKAFFETLFAEVKAGGILATTSELTFGEVLVRPLLRKARGLVALYEEMLAQGAAIRTVPVSRAILRAAARLNGFSKMGLPDCIHVATAMNAGCDVFFSNDGGIKLPSEMELRRFDVAS